MSFQGRLQTLRDGWGRPIVVTSGYRCPAYNALKSKTGRTGPHTVAAVDVWIDPALVWDFIELATSLGFSGLGLHQHGPHAERFVHLDDLPNGSGCPRPRVWTY